MERLPAEIQLHIIDYLLDTKDKIELSSVNRPFYHLLFDTPRCWSPLDLSLYANQITNSILLSILRSRALTIVPSPPRLHGWNDTMDSPYSATDNSQTNAPQSYRHQLEFINISGCHLLTSEAVMTLVCTLPFLKGLILNRYPSMSAADPLARHPRHYRRTRLTMIDMLRDDLYQCRPRHGLASTTMDLSKKPLCCLAIADTVLRQILHRVPLLTSLSLQHQSLGATTVQQLPLLLPNLCHLDISSCDIALSSLQSLLRHMDGRLISLKMLNLDLSNLTLLCLQLHGSKSLQVLHLSCIDPQWFLGVVRVVQLLPHLHDFRLTRLRLGNIDPLLAALASHPHLERVDLSPKLELYPKNLSPSYTILTASSALGTIGTQGLAGRGPPATATSRPFRVMANIRPSSSSTNMPDSPTNQTSGSHREKTNNDTTSANYTHQATGALPPSTGLEATGNQRRPVAGHLYPAHPHYHPHSRAQTSHYNNYSRYNNTMFTRAEHSLTMTPSSLLLLAPLADLTELRLCYPSIDAASLTRFFKTTTASHQLKILELRLRQKPSPLDNDDDESSDYLDGLSCLAQLHTLLLYHVPLRSSTVEHILGLACLQSLTLYDGGPLGKLQPFFLRHWLLGITSLAMVRMDLVPFSLDTLTDLVMAPMPSELSQDAQRQYEGDVMLLKQNGLWHWIN
ncbi:hypothetical protein DM01DRAFT_1332011 [Hesseltinella vesiculosa]|uniref:F-box domain-containing protein n=1 Tax=Hesseltinella vesiculosa TaxID=101127 RepID=A0A1X2GTQ4_9FUNG|nr:hypothetical protein DM01DRAFT_1332011 [Hesseltinella vesiculosa]